MVDPAAARGIGEPADPFQRQPLGFLACARLAQALEAADSLDLIE
jgi:hypothetical protein